MRLVCLAFISAALLSACGHDDDHEAFATYQACFDDHTMEESLTVSEAIVVCCLDHPIAGMTQPVCGNAAADCETYLSVNLTQGATMEEKTAACAEYITQKNM